MPSDGSGVFSLDSGYLAVTGQTITISQHNPVLEDIRDGLTARLMRSGVAPMTGPLKLADGTAGAPSLTFSNAATQGFYKTTSGIGVSIGGTKVGEWLAGGLQLSGIDLIGGTSFTDLALTDTMPAYDVSATANKRILVSDVLKIINLLTADASPDSAADYVMTYDASATAAKKVLLGSLPVVLPRGYMAGCTLSNGTDATNDIDFAAGVCRDSTDAVNITVPAISGKQLDANWVAGAGAGMRNSAAGIANATYHLYAVRTAASATADIYAYAGVAGTDPDSSASISTMLTALQAETGGASYVYARRLGSIVRTGAAIKPFTQIGDYFGWTTLVADISATNPGTSAVTRTLTVPLGITARADTQIIFQTGTSTSALLISPLTATDETPTSTRCTLESYTVSNPIGSVVLPIYTNSSGQVRSRVSLSDGNVIVTINTRGYHDSRGKDA